MPTCMVVGCNTKTGVHPNLSTFKIPDPFRFKDQNSREFKNEKERAQQWLHSLKRGFTVNNFKFSKDRRLCEKHFKPEMFEEDLQAKFLGYEPSCKKLKPTAVPTEFPHCKKTMDPRTFSTERAMEHDRRQLISQLLQSPESKKTKMISKQSSKKQKKKNIDNHTQLKESETQTYATSTLINISVQTDEEPKRERVEAGTQTEPREELFYQPRHFIDSAKYDHTYSLAPHKTGSHTRKLQILQKRSAEEKVNLSDFTVEGNKAESSQKQANNGKKFSVSDDDLSISNAGVPPMLPNENAEEDLEDSMSKITDRSDSSFHVSDYSDSESEPEGEKDLPNKVVDEKKFIVFESALDNLIMELRCPSCGLRAYEIRKSISGTAIRIQTECLEGHLIIDWKSQKFLGKMAAGNLLCSAAILYSGETYSHIANWAKFLNLEFIGHSQFYEIQRDILVPAINETFEVQKKTVKEELNGNETWYSGDARFDSPGYSAKYGSYSLMGQKSKKIITTQLVHVNESGSSNACEKEGFKRCLGELESDNIQIDLLATDRHPGITKFMDERGKEEYEYDLWHVTKSIKKDLSKRMKKKGCAAIGPWIKCITNHLWWASENCNGDVEKLKSDWLSLQYHIVNLHCWKVDGKWQKCPHEKLTREKIRRKKWLKPGSIAHLSVIEVISKAKLLKSLQKLTRACHTSELESFHSLCTKYCPKRQEFDYEIMDVRMKMAVLDHNENVGRKQATVTKKTKKSKDIGSKRWKISCSKQTKTWSAKRVLEEKTYHFVHNLMVSSAIKKMSKPLVKPEKSTKPANIPKNIAPVPMPAKEELLKRRELQDMKQTESKKRTLENEIKVREGMEMKRELARKKNDGNATRSIGKKKKTKKSKDKNKDKEIRPGRKRRKPHPQTSTPKKAKM